MKVCANFVIPSVLVCGSILSRGFRFFFCKIKVKSPRVETLTCFGLKSKAEGTRTFDGVYLFLQLNLHLGRK